MGMVQMDNNGPATNRLAKQNQHLQDENSQKRNVVEGKEDQRRSDEHESRANEDHDRDDHNGKMGSVRVLDRNESGQAKSKHRGKLVRWDKFLPFRSLKVMLVENDDATRHLISALLRNCGYEVNAVENGRQAWNILEDRTTDVDLVLTEVVMAGLSGIGLLCKMMSKKMFKDIPVIMMSSHDSKSMVFKCLSKGAVDFLVKPLRKNELKNLWQHVWRKYHMSNGASGSESGIWNEKSMKSRTMEESDNNAGSNNEDDNESDSGTQSSWTTRAIDVDSPQPISPQDQFLASTCAQASNPRKESFGNNWVSERGKTIVEEDEDREKKIMGKDLRIGIYSSPSLQLEDPGEDGFTSMGVVDKDKCEQHLKKCDLNLNNEQPNEENLQANDILGPSSDTIEPGIESATHEFPNGISKSTSMTDKAIHEHSEIPFFEVLLKRPRDVQDTGTIAHYRNVLRHSDLSAFSRYNSDSTRNLDPIGNVDSCSPVDNSSDAAKTESTPNIQSDSNGTTPNQRSNSSGNNNDMGSTTNDASTKKVSFTDKTTAMLQSSCAVEQGQDGQPSAQPIIQGGSQSVSSNVLRVAMDGNVSNRNLNRFASGSKHGANGHKRGNNASTSRGKKAESNIGKLKAAEGYAYRNRTEDEENRFAHREAALKRFRQKRQERCFEKKVRYQSRKKLAEQRPRIRGQFIRKGMHDTRGKGISYEPNPTPP